MTDTGDDAASGETMAFDHEVWRALLGTGVGYGVVLLAMFLVLFVVPFLLFLAF